MPSPKHLFVYGTLRRDHRTPEVVELMRNLEFVGEASVPGQLFDLGEYPGAIFEPASRNRVQGEVYKLPNNPQVLRKLDIYEEFRPGHPQKSLFIRQTATVQTRDGEKLNCWAYRINRRALKKPKPRKRAIRIVGAKSARATR